MKQLNVGDFSCKNRVVDATVMSSFGSLVQDDNPIHHDFDAAVRAGFRGPIAHGMVAGSMFSEILGNTLPGPGAVYASQNFSFLAPIYIGDNIELRVEVIEIRADQRVVKVRTTCTNSDGVLCIDGEAVLIRRKIAAVAES